MPFVTCTISCASYAYHKLPIYLKDLERDIHNYFNSGPEKKFENTGSGIKIQAKLIHPSQTCWLFLESVVEVLLDQEQIIFPVFGLCFAII